MTLKERWDKAGCSEITPIGRLVILVTSILLFFRLPSWTNFYELIGSDSMTEILIGFILFWFALVILLTVLLALISFILSIILWVLVGDWKFDEGSNLIETGFELLEQAFLMVFGDYENKYDF